MPKSIALNLTVPELVTAFNVEEMAQLVARGPLEHPGARCAPLDLLIEHDERYTIEVEDMAPPVVALRPRPVLLPTSSVGAS